MGCQPCPLLRLRIKALCLTDWVDGQATRSVITIQRANTSKIILQRGKHTASPAESNEHVTEQLCAELIVDRHWKGFSKGRQLE